MPSGAIDVAFIDGTRNDLPFVHKACERLIWCELLLLLLQGPLWEREREEDREERIMSKCHLYIFNFHHRYVFATQKPQFTYYGTARRRVRSVALRPASTAAPPLHRTLGRIATARRHSGLISSTPHLLSIRKVSGLSPYSSHGSFGSNATVECSRTR